MIVWLIWVVLAFLFIVSIMDIKARAVPSILLTAFIFAVAVLNPNNLHLGILGGIMALLLHEADFYRGVADIKIFATISFMLPTVYTLFIFIIFVMVGGMIWKIGWTYQYGKEKKKAPDELPFIPVFLAVYIALMIMGVVT